MNVDGQVRHCHESLPCHRSRVKGEIEGQQAAIANKQKTNEGSSQPTTMAGEVVRLGGWDHRNDYSCVAYRLHQDSSLPSEYYLEDESQYKNPTISDYARSPSEIQSPTLSTSAICLDVDCIESDCRRLRHNVGLQEAFSYLICRQSLHVLPALMVACPAF